MIENKTTLAIVAIRSSALALAIAGQGRASDQLFTLADLIEAGQATDAHMRLIADKLRERPIGDDDWQDVLERIRADSDRLQAAGKPAGTDGEPASANETGPAI